MEVHKIYPVFTFKKGVIGGEGSAQQYLEFDVTAKGTGFYLLLI